ncbi:hypothetical protein AAMO2058_000258600 [Amorphochlora amoebiformis]
MRARFDGGRRGLQRATFLTLVSLALAALHGYVPHRIHPQHRTYEGLSSLRSSFGDENKIPSIRRDPISHNGCATPDPSLNNTGTVIWQAFGEDSKGCGDKRNLPVPRDYRQYLHHEKKLIPEEECGEPCECINRQLRHLIYVNKEWVGDRRTAKSLKIPVGDWQDRFFGFRETLSLAEGAEVNPWEKELEPTLQNSNQSDCESSYTYTYSSTDSEPKTTVYGGRPLPEEKSGEILELEDESVRPNYQELDIFRRLEFYTPLSHSSRMSKSVRIDVFEGEMGFDSAEGVKVWGGGFVSAWYLGMHPHLVTNKTVIDLGTGTGIVGLVAASLNASRVILNDNDEEVETVLRRNVRENMARIQTSCKVEIKLRDFIQEFRDVGILQTLTHIGQMDTVIASEFVFESNGLQNYFEALLTFLKPGGLLLYVTGKYVGVNEVVHNLKQYGKIISILDTSLLSGCEANADHKCRADIVVLVFQKGKKEGEIAFYDKPIPEDFLDFEDDRTSHPNRNIPDLIHRLWRLAISRTNPHQGSRTTPFKQKPSLIDPSVNPNLNQESRKGSVNANELKGKPIQTVLAALFEGNVDFSNYTADVGGSLEGLDTDGGTGGASGGGVS